MCFRDTDAIAIAVEMERRGAELYRRAAVLCTEERTHALLTELGADEIVHQRDFARLLEEVRDTDTAYSEETGAFLSAVAAEIAFPEGLTELLTGPGEILETAIRSEKDSILFYTELSQCAVNADARDTFRRIVMTERNHLARLDRMLAQLG